MNKKLVVEYELEQIWNSLRGMALTREDDLKRIQQLEKKVAYLIQFAPMKED